MEGNLNFKKMKNKDMLTNKFFQEQTPSSRIKANIVAKYFPQYCKIILKSSQKEIRYLDLFAGPGIYRDGNFSTPLLIAESCGNDLELSNKVRMLFNDNEFSEELKNNFYKHFSVKDFQKEPRFGDKTVGNYDKITEYLKKYHPKKNPYPTLLFFDPWGYKPIDTNVLANFLKNWGNEIFLFVNIKRIHAAIKNDKFDTLMKSLFPTSFQDIKNQRRYTSNVSERLNLIVDNLAGEFKHLVGKNLYHCAFKFQEEDSKQTSHFIIHFTKHSRGYELVKQIYYDFDNIGAELSGDGNYTFDSKKMYETNQTFNFEDRNLIDLSDNLRNKYSGKEISAKKLFEEHHYSTKYCGSHYVQTLRYMKENNHLESYYTDNKEHKVSVLLINECILKFK